LTIACTLLVQQIMVTQVNLIFSFRGSGLEVAVGVAFPAPAHTDGLPDLQVCSHNFFVSIKNSEPTTLAPTFFGVGAAPSS
jgi:hypothetical protein